MPVVRAVPCVPRRLVAALISIGVLALAIDHAPAATNLPRSLAEWGQEVTAVDAAGPGRWTIAVVKRVE